MKITKSFLLITVCLCATNLLHAQEAEAKATPVKPLEVAAKPMPTPPLQPGSTAVPQTTAENAKQIPDPKKEENIITPDKRELKAIEIKPANTIKNEPVIIQPVLMPNTNDPNVKAAPVTKSAAVKQQ